VELVSNVSVALNAYFLDKGRWPSALSTPAAGGNGLLDKKAAVPLAANRLLSLSYNEDTRTLTGFDRFGVVTPWAMRVIKRLNKSNDSTATKIPPSDRELSKHILHYALDLDGDGITEANVGGETVKIRGNAAVWCIGAEGGDKNGDPWPYKEGKRKLTDVYSWTDKQVVQ